MCTKVILPGKQETAIAGTPTETAQAELTVFGFLTCLPHREEKGGE